MPANDAPRHAAITRSAPVRHDTNPLKALYLMRAAALDEERGVDARAPGGVDGVDVDLLALIAALDDRARQQR